MGKQWPFVLTQSSLLCVGVQESTSGGGTEKEGRQTVAHSSEDRAELQVYTELLAIRDKMKVHILCIMRH